MVKCQAVPHTKHIASIPKTNQLMMYKAAGIYGTHGAYTVWAECRASGVKPGGTYNNHWGLKGKYSSIPSLCQMVTPQEIIAPKQACI